MTDISNKTLAVFLVVATMVSLGGFFLSFSQLDGITGHAVDTDTGDANFSINSTVAVAFVSNRIDFGPGIVNGSGLHNCTLNTTGPGMRNGGTNPTGGPDCIGFYASVQPLRIQNQGTQNVTLNISFNATGAQFVTGTTPELSFRASLNESGACGSGFNSALTPITTQYQNHSICGTGYLNWVTGARTINIDIGLRIPQDAVPGERDLVVTAYGNT